MKKIFRIVVLVLSALLLIGLSYFLLKRDVLLKNYLSRTILRLKNEDHIDLKVGSLEFNGFSEIEGKNISLVPQHADSLLSIDQIRVGISVWPLFLGKIKINTLDMSHSWVHLVRKNGVRNYEFLLKKKKGKSQSLPLYQILDNILNQALYEVPDNLSLHSLLVSFKTDQHYFYIQIPNAEIQNHILSSTFIWSEVGKPWHLTGYVHPSRKLIDLKLFSETKSLFIPYLKTKFNLDLQADTLQGALKGENLHSDNLNIEFSGGAHNLVFHHPKISDGNVSFPYLRFDGKVHLGLNTVSVDSSSTLTVNQLKAHPFISYTFSGNKEYSLRFKTEMGPAQNLFDALPQGLFESMQGIKVSGNLAYHLNFHLEKNHPYDLDFEAGFERDHFKILHFGKENLQKINASFLYTPYEYGKPMRTRVVGPANPNYTPIGQISPYLRDAVVSSEDPNFYSHHGIDEYAFRKVIAIDYQAKSFKRGASTISMQLVKNTYLNREKTISRKAEEMLITWLLENMNLVSKQRILEVYLNIIEWGPNIYGVGEASHFYFNKPPAELSLGESIFLTHIIPRPKAYQYSFNPDGSLKSYIQNYYHFIAGNLFRKGKIQGSDTLSMFQIQLRGPAAGYVIRTPDSLSAQDTLDIPIGDPTLIPGKKP